jgi:hypothetical protein
MFNFFILLQRKGNHFARQLSLLLLFCFLAGSGLSAQNFVAKLAGSQEVPTITTPATGMVTASYDANNQMLTVSGTFEGLTGDLATNIVGGAHIHLGYAGQNGGVEFVLNSELNSDNRSGSFVADSNMFMLNAAQEEALLGRQLYINIHSDSFAGGELRGQLLPAGATAYFQANLLGSQEIPAVITEAYGSVQAELNGSDLIVSGAFDNLSSDVDVNIVGGAHLHLGLPGQNGGVAFVLNTQLDADQEGGVFLPDSNTFSLNNAQLQALQERGIYVNIHSLNYGGGELRGQVLAQADAYFQANLHATQAMPVSVSPGQGTVIFELDGNDLVAVGGYENASSELDTSIAGGVHIHEGLAGQSGGVVKLINSTHSGGLENGVFAAANNQSVLSMQERQQLFERGFYVNLHTLKYGGGELRGQILGQSQAYFYGMLSGGFEAPVVSSNGSGAVAAEWTGNEIRVSGAFQNLESDFDPNVAGGAHIHAAPIGSNGAPLKFFTIDLASDNRSGSFPITENTFELDSAELMQLMDYEFYVNIHTVDNAAGELRAPLIPQTRALFVANLSGDGQTPAVRTDAIGQAVAAWDGDSLRFAGSFAELSSPLDISIAGGAHIHWNIAGMSGPVRQVLTSDLNMDMTGGEFPVSSNSFALSASGQDSLMQRMAYVNIHSMDFGAGEIRGQLLPLASHYFTATLAAENTLPKVSSMGSGLINLELRGDFLTASGSFNGLTDELDESIAGGVHIHANRSGFNGGVEFLINSELEADKLSGVFLADSNRNEINAMERVTLMEGGYYINLHSLEHTPGELRGQVLMSPNSEPEGGFIVTSPPSDATVVIQGDPSTLAMIDWNNSIDPNGDSLAYRWQLAADQEFSTILADIATEDQSMLELTFGAIDTLLADAGVMPGGSVKVYHRAIGTDGSLPVNGVADSVTFVRGNLTSVEEEMETSSFTVVPDESGNAVTVKLRVFSSGDAQLALYDIQGRVLSNENWEVFPGANERKLGLNALAPGVYFISYQRENIQITKKWMVK